MVDRVIVYDSALGQTTDVLNTNKFGMVGTAFLSRAILGGATVVHGLSCTAQVPATLQVNVGAGSIYQLDEVDATAYGDLGTDTNTILKQGILYLPVSLTITPPSTAGFSQVFLVEAIIDDIDAGQQVISYFNAANPAVPFSGPNNDGASQFTTRTSICNIALKAGVAATTGTQQIPAPDSGFVGLFAITVVNGQSTVTSANIVQLATAPFFPTLPSVPGAVQNETWVGFDDTSSVANVLQITPYPPVTAYNKYQKWVVRPKFNNTGPATLNANGLGAVAIQLPSGALLSGGELKAGSIAELVFDGAVFELVSSPANAGGGGGSPTTTYLTGVVNLQGQASQNTKAASWTVDQIVAAVTIGGVAYQGNGLTLSFTGASNGVNGMDNGNMPNNGDLSIYAIYNPTSAIWGTLGVNGTTSNGQIYTGTHMPSGYTASRLLFVGCTDGSGNFKTAEPGSGTLAFYQLDNTVWISSSGFLTNGAATSPTSVSLSNVVPNAATSVAGNFNVQNATGNGAAATIGGTAGRGTGGGIGQGAIGVQWGGAFASASTNFGFIPIITPLTLFYTVSGSPVIVTIAVILTPSEAEYDAVRSAFI